MQIFYQDSTVHQRDNVVYWKTNGKINNDLCTSVYSVLIHSPITMPRSARRITTTSGLTVVIGFECSPSTAACTVIISMLTLLCIVQHVWLANWPFPAQHSIHSLSATQLTRKVRSSCAEACGGKHARCQRLHMTLASFVSKKRHQR